MKCIHKTLAPPEYTEWCLEQEQTGVNFNYSNLQNPQKRILHSALLVEQGYICPYTMRRVRLDSTHLEHIKPQHICRNERSGLDLDYFNLIACFPKGNCQYGARAKDDWWLNNQAEFLSPLNDSCELRFIFNLKGEIYPTIESNDSTNTTISVLRLDHPILTEERKKSIQEFIFGEKGDSPLNQEESQLAISMIYKPNSDGLLFEFCIALHDALYEYLDLIKRSIENGKSN